jgi:hypothetical protein
MCPLVGSCEHGNEAFDSIKGREFFDHLSDCQLLKEDSVPWSWYINCLGYVMSGGRTVIKDELEWIWKEAVVTCFKCCPGIYLE